MTNIAAFIYILLFPNVAIAVRNVSVSSPKSASAKDSLQYSENPLVQRISLSLQEQLQNSLINKIGFLLHSNNLRKQDEHHNFIFRNGIHSVFPSKHLPLIRNRKRSSPSVNKKVFLYGRDDRKKILNRFEYPYFNVVRISTGCTGTLVTPSYVLTAAHCVHDGVDFKKHLEMLKVEVPHRFGSRIHYIRKISVPRQWALSFYNRDRFRAAHDYAVIELSIPATSHYEFMPLHIPDSKVIYRKLYFLAYPSNSYYLWKNKCASFSGRVVYNGNVLVSQCDSSAGNSGAALYTENARGDGKIVGVLSSSGNARIANLRRIPYSFINLLTHSKIKSICHIISPEAEKYGVCPPAHSMLAAGSVSNRIVPFYG